MKNEGVPNARTPHCVEQNEDAIIGESYDSSEVKDAAHATLHTTIFLGCILTLSDPKARSYPKVENGLPVSLTLQLKFKKKPRCEGKARRRARKNMQDMGVTSPLTSEQ